MVELISAEECTGCLACQVVCPHDAIEIVQSEEGFFFPQIKNETCCKCGLCVKRCPISQKCEKGISGQRGFIVQSKDRRLKKRSASGGAFASIAKYFLIAKNAVIIGASLCEDLTVRHIAIEELRKLKSLQNSKYVQSMLGDIYVKAKKYLDDGRTVFFTGTPCQIAGLYAVLSGKDYENLYTADIVCHGVPSPAFFKRQLAEDSKSRQGRVIDVKFRCKNLIFASNSSYFMMMMMMIGLPLIRKPIQDPYFNLFMKGKDFRESCYNCKFANLDRVGDFTFGDCDSAHLYSNFHPDESNSIILLNSEKANQLWNDIIHSNFDYAELDVEKEAECNHQLRQPFVRPDERSGIYQELLKSDWEQVKSKYAVSQKKLERYKLLILLVVPPFIVRAFGKLRKGT